MAPNNFKIQNLGEGKMKLTFSASGGLIQGTKTKPNKFNGIEYFDGGKLEPKKFTCGSNRYYEFTQYKEKILAQRIITL